MDKRNVSNIMTTLAGTHNATMTKLHDAQCEACINLDPIEAVDVILRLQRIAAKVDRAFGADLAQLDQSMPAW